MHNTLTDSMNQHLSVATSESGVFVASPRILPDRFSGSSAPSPISAVPEQLRSTSAPLNLTDQG